MRTCNLVRFGVIAAMTTGAAVSGALVASAHQAQWRARSVTPVAPPTVKFTHPGHLPAPAAGTFVSLVPSCACNDHTALVQFSLRDGRRLGALATLAAFNPPAFQVSDPHPAPPGSFELTFSRGPLCQQPPGGGVSFGPCNPQPNTCTSVVERINLLAGSITTVLNAPNTQTVTDAIPSPNGRRLVLIGGPCRPARRYLTVRDLASGRQWTLGADVPRCTWIGPGAAWSPDGTRLIFPYAPVIGRPPSNPEFCNGTRLPGLVIAAADRNSTSHSWTVIHADRHCGFLYGVFDPQGIAAVEGCDYGQPPGSGADPHLGDAFLLQLSGPRHQVIQRLALKRGFDGGTVVEDPRTGTVLISEYQAANDGVHPYNWVWAYANGTLRLIHRYDEDDAPEITAEPW